MGVVASLSEQCARVTHLKAWGLVGYQTLDVTSAGEVDQTVAASKMTLQVQHHDVVWVVRFFALFVAHRRFHHRYQCLLEVLSLQQA
jgi:hypothetical protein